MCYMYLKPYLNVNNTNIKQRPMRMLQIYDIIRSQRGVHREKQYIIIGCATPCTWRLVSEYHVDYETIPIA